MSRRAQLGVLSAALALAALLAPGWAAARAPLVMSALYVEPARDADNPAPPSAGGCAVRIVELTDTRRAPTTLGTLASFRAINAPNDREAWLRSVIDVGLAARGFKPSFVTPQDPAQPGALTAHIRLQAFWISLATMTKAGSAVFRMSVAAPGAVAGPEKVYRGDQSGLDWVGSQSEFNGLVDRVFAKSLDAMAADLRPLCPAGAAQASAAPAGP